MTDTLLLFEDDESMRWVLKTALEQAHYQVHAAATAVGAEALIARYSPKLVLSDIRMPERDGLALLDAIKRDDPELPVILMTAHSDLSTAVAAYEHGAFDYLPKPFDLDELIRLVRRALETHHSSHDEAARQSDQGPALIGESPPMQQLFRAIGRLSRSEVTTLLTGESGTGKELLAHALHQNSPRSQGPFVALNMAAIPADLIESELFGHEKGAFTGANERHLGRFEQASGGTLFLDEIGDMPLVAQTRLLRVLAEGVFYRVGGKQAQHARARIVTATHRDLTALVARGTFREDLYHRLNVVRLQIPPLRQRTGDLPLLVKHLLQRAADETGMLRKQPDTELLDYLATLPWPGNVRQLDNLCRWLTVMVTGRGISVADLPDELRAVAPQKNHWEDEFSAWLAQQLTRNQRQTVRGLQQHFEHLLLGQVLEHNGGHRQKTADWLGWGRNTITRKLAQEDSPGAKETNPWQKKK